MNEDESEQTELALEEMRIIPHRADRCTRDALRLIHERLKKLEAIETDKQSNRE